MNPFCRSIEIILFIILYSVFGWSIQSSHKLGITSNQYLVNDSIDNSNQDTKVFFLDAQFLQRLDNDSISNLDSRFDVISDSNSDSVQNVGLAFDIEGRYTNKKNGILNYLAFNEFYYKSQFLNPNFDFKVGRAIENWNQLDSHWRLGIWQPILKIEPLDPKEQGLTGFFVHWTKPHLDIQFFATPFFIPDQGPNYEVQDGQFKSGDRWMSLPPQSVSVLNAQTAISYQLEKPQISSIIFQEGYSAKMQFWSDSQNKTGYSLKMSYAQLPSNQFNLGLQGRLKISNSDEKVSLILKPQVSYHRLMGLDLEYKSDLNSSLSTQAGISYLSEEPQPVHFSEGWTYPMEQKNNFISPKISFNYRSIYASTSYLKRFGSDVQMIGPLQQAVVNVLPLKYNFNEYIKQEFLWRTFQAGSVHWSQFLNWMRELQEKSDIITYQSTLQWVESWNCYFGFNLIATDNKNPHLQDLAEVFQNNDRVYGGINYAF